MVKDEADRPGVIAPPPFVYLFFLMLGLAIDFAWPLAVLPACLKARATPLWAWSWETSSLG